MGRQIESDQILLIDHQPIYRGGLRTALIHGGYAVVGEAATAHLGLRAAEELLPGIIIIEALLPGVNGFVTAAYIRRALPNVKIIMISSEQKPTLTASAIRVGAMGFIQKSDEPEAILETLHAVKTGHNILQARAMTDEATTRLLIAYLRSDRRDLQPNGGPDLSPRELEVLDCLLMGYSNRDIADALFITEQTVKNHMTSIMRKLSVTDRVAALRVAMSSGWSCLGVPALVDDPVLSYRR
jgi:DNA-binding NarL/FixJ family response regulator